MGGKLYLCYSTKGLILSQLLISPSSGVHEEPCVGVRGTVITHGAFLSDERVRVYTHTALILRHKKRDFAVEPRSEVILLGSDLLEEVLS